MSRALLFLAPLLVLSSSCAPGPARPDVVLVVVDTLRADRLGAYGCERGLTPNLDAVAEQSVVFEDCQAPAPWTAPSLVSLMTSVRPEVHGVGSFPVPGMLSPDTRTLAQELRERGYATAAFTEGGYAQPSFGLGRGFDVYPAQPGDQHGFHSNVEAPSRLRGTVDRAIEWWERERRRPRFLFVHTYEVHHPLRPPEEDLRALRPGYDEERELASVRSVIERWNAAREIDAAGARALRRHSFHHDFATMPPLANPDALLAECRRLGVPLEKDRAVLDAEEREWLRDLYDAEVRFTDREFGRLFDALERAESPHGTVLVVTSDHGEGLGEHGRLGHGEHFTEELMRVVLTIRAPGVPPGRVAELVRTLDVMPTLLEFAGVESEGLPIQGRNVTPLLQGVGDGAPWAVGQALSANGGRDPRRSIKRGRFRLVLDLRSGEARLHDLATDPGETRDVAADHPKVAELLERALREEVERDARLRERLGEPGAAELDEDTLEELRRLGYVDD